MTSLAQDMGHAQGSVATYRIRVAGVLGEEWSERAHDMTVSVCRSETERVFTELVGVLPDEAALMGVLEALYAHGARLLSVKSVETDRSGVIPQAPEG